MVLAEAGTTGRPLSEKALRPFRSKSLQELLEALIVIWIGSHVLRFVWSRFGRFIDSNQPLYHRNMSTEIIMLFFASGYYMSLFRLLFVDSTWTHFVIGKCLHLLGEFFVYFGRTWSCYYSVSLQTQRQLVRWCCFPPTWIDATPLDLWKTRIAVEYGIRFCSSVTSGVVLLLYTHTLLQTPSLSLVKQCSVLQFLEFVVVSICLEIAIFIVFVCIASAPNRLAFYRLFDFYGSMAWDKMFFCVVMVSWISLVIFSNGLAFAVVESCCSSPHLHFCYKACACHTPNFRCLDQQVESMLCCDKQTVHCNQTCT